VTDLVKFPFETPNNATFRLFCVMAIRVVEPNYAAISIQSQNQYTDTTYIKFKTMSRKVSLFLSGVFILIPGILLIVLYQSTFETIRYVLLAFLAPSAILSLITAIKRYREQIQFVYHEIHALALLIYVVALFGFCTKFEQLNKYSVFLFMFYAVSEIIFCSLLFNLKGKVILNTLILRIAFSFIIGIGTTIIVSTQEILQTTKLMGYGVVFILMGINSLLYRPIMSQERLPISDTSAR
jgi:hypothetical protein